MKRSAVAATWCRAALLLILAAGCSGPPESGAESAKAHEAWKKYLSEPGPMTYGDFIKSNRVAADHHSNPHDAAGVEYQLRALEVQAAEAERIKDAALADSVLERVGEIESRDQTGVYDEVVPGAKTRLAAAKARAERVSR